jgi:alkylation response protein AidB-like acyl-CoA dehydrogenase
MELAYTEKEQAFRAEVRRFVDENLPADIRRKVLEHKKMGREDFLRWHRILHKRGWVAPHWPVEQGGTGWSVVERHIFEDELAEAALALPEAAGTRSAANAGTGPAPRSRRIRPAATAESTSKEARRAAVP